MLDLPANIQFDTSLSYVDRLQPVTALGRAGIPSYVTLDARISWRPTKNVELAIVGQSLLDHRHPEAAPISNTAPRTEVPRSIFGKIAIQF